MTKPLEITHGEITSNKARLTKSNLTNNIMIMMMMVIIIIKTIHK